MEIATYTDIEGNPRIQHTFKKFNIAPEVDLDRFVFDYINEDEYTGKFLLVDNEELLKSNDDGIIWGIAEQLWNNLSDLNKFLETEKYKKMSETSKKFIIKRVEELYENSTTNNRNS